MVGYQFKCPKCKGAIYLTDIMRLQEGVDNELGAGGIVSYLMTTLEQITIATSSACCSASTRPS